MDRLLITGGAGFIGSNLCEYFLNKGFYVRVLDNFSTGHKYNIESFLNNSKFELVEGDIRDLSTCNRACHDVDYILHEAALGSVPRSISDPISTNDVNISGFLNMLVAARDNNVKRFVYAASSSTYGDSKELPKLEENIGKPLSPYAITKYVNELYADIFSKTYGLETIGLRYFNVFGRRQDPDGAYAAVIPKFISLLISHTSPVINGSGEISRDFTYIDNIIELNELALFTSNQNAINNVFNGAVGEQTSLLELINCLKLSLSRYDHSIKEIDVKFGPKRLGDIPHSLASISKAQNLLGYQPKYNLKRGLEVAIEWYWNNLKK